MSKFLDEKGLRQLIELIRNLNSEGDSEGMMLSAGDAIDITSDNKINVKFDDISIKLDDDGKLKVSFPLPEVSAADKDKILTVNSEGKWEASLPQTSDSPIKIFKTLSRRYTDPALVADVENKLGIPTGDLAELYELVDLNGNSISYYDMVNYLNNGVTVVVKSSGLLYYLDDIGPKEIIPGWPATVRDCIGSEMPESYGLYYFNWSFNGDKLLYISY